MGLGVGNAGLRIPPVGQGVGDVAHLPGLVRGFEDLNPFVCDGHLQPVVKAHTSLCHRPADKSLISFQACIQGVSCHLAGTCDSCHAGLLAFMDGVGVSFRDLLPPMPCVFRKIGCRVSIAV